MHTQIRRPGQMDYLSEKIYNIYLTIGGDKEFKTTGVQTRERDTEREEEAEKVKERLGEAGGETVREVGEGRWRERDAFFFR
eukprot:1136096-Amorphochlora_amoeboformis.AAC.1